LPMPFGLKRIPCFDTSQFQKFPNPYQFFPIVHFFPILNSLSGGKNRSNM
jgi:hypothetical protein